MNVQEFAQALERGVPGGKYIRVNHFNKFSKTHENVIMTFINLPKERMANDHGVLGLNNRLQISIDGFPRHDSTQDATKVKASLMTKGLMFDKMRAKSGTPEQILKYILAHLAKQAEKEPWGPTSHTRESIFTPRQEEVIAETLSAAPLQETVDAAYAKTHAATSPEEYASIFDRLKSKQTVWMSWKSYGSGSGDTTTFSPYTVGRRSFSKKYKISSVSLLRPGQRSASSLVKLTLFKGADGRVSIAIGDMGAKLLGLYAPSTQEGVFTPEQREFLSEVAETLGDA